MLNDISSNQQVYLVTGYTDLRRSIDGLAMIIQGQLRLDPFSSALFLFCGRRRDRIKGLLWEGDGFLLLYKRLDNGQFQWPRNEMICYTDRAVDKHPKIWYNRNNQTRRGKSNEVQQRIQRRSVKAFR